MISYREYDTYMYYSSGGGGGHLCEVSRVGVRCEFMVLFDWVHGGAPCMLNSIKSSK